MEKLSYKSFWFHYNKPASVQKGKPQITVHYNNTCHLVDNLECSVPTKGRIRKAQPRWVISGKLKSFEIKNGIAIIK